VQNANAEPYILVHSGNETVAREVHDMNALVPIVLHEAADIVVKYIAIMNAALFIVLQAGKYALFKLLLSINAPLLISVTLESVIVDGNVFNALYQYSSLMFSIALL
jgi:hypothetical protein